MLKTSVVSLKRSFFISKRGTFPTSDSALLDNHDRISKYPVLIIMGAADNNILTQYYSNIQFMYVVPGIFLAVCEREFIHTCEM